MTWSKEPPGPGMYRCRGPNIEEDEIIVCVYEPAPQGTVAANPGVIPEGIKLLVVKPDSYMTPVGAPTTFGHPIYRDAEWAPHDG